MSTRSPRPMPRRIVFQGLGALGVAVALAGCGGGDDGGSGDGDGTGGGAGGTAAGTALVATSEVPVGGGVVLSDQGLVVVQPEEGTFKAFSSACTHQGTPVNAPSDGVMLCPNHGSEFSVEDGSVITGPAVDPLAEVEVTVDGDQVVTV